LHNTQISLEQINIIQQLLDANKGAKADRKAIQRKLEEGRMSFEEADGAIQTLCGENASSAYWNTIYPGGGSTITSVLRPYVEIQTIGLPIDQLERYTFKTFERMLEHPYIPHMCLCPMSQVREVNQHVVFWMDDFLNDALCRRMNQRASLLARELNAGRMFLERLPPHIRFNQECKRWKMPRSVRKRLWSAYVTKLSLAAAACYYQDEELLDCMRHALSLFVKGNPILGFANHSGKLLVLVSETHPVIHHQHRVEPRRFTPIPQRMEAVDPASLIFS